MADDTNARDKQARDADRRQRERDVTAQLECSGDRAPGGSDGTRRCRGCTRRAGVPGNRREVVAAAGDHGIQSEDGAHAIRGLVPETDEERFDSPAAVRQRVQRPTVAATMKRILEAGGSHAEFGSSQRNAYERTLRELEAIDAVDDEGITAIGDWIVEQIHEKETLPGSRAVRREAAKICRANGYEVRNDEWLGV